MSIIKKIVWNLSLIVKKIRYSCYQPKKVNLTLPIPYHSQLNTGAKSKALQKLWRKNGCGMACLQMILDHKLKLKIPLYKLGERCLGYGGFIENPKNPDGLDGLFYKPFINFLKEEFNLDGKIISPLTLKEIIMNLERSNYVLASVSSSIYSACNPEVSSQIHFGGGSSKNGGHLILVTGFDYLRKKLFINNPSGNPKGCEQISFENFKTFFAGRGVIVST